MNNTGLEKYIIDLRRHFHMSPELSGNEENTSKRIAEELDKLGIPYYRLPFSHNSICAQIAGTGCSSNKADIKTVLLRADIDALPICEETNLEFSSKNDGAMHACGHDAHTAMLLGAAKILCEEKDSICGNIKLVFESGEEIGAYGKKISESDVFDGVATAFGIHVQEGIPSDKISIQPGIRMSGAGFFKIDIYGEGGHGSSPDKGIDVIPAASAMVMNLQTIVSREISPLDSAVVSVGTFHAGTKANIIADKAELTGSLRFFNKNIQKKLPESFARIVMNTAVAYRVRADVICKCTMPPVINDEYCSQIAYKALAQIADLSVAYTCEPSTGSDDFCYYLDRVPGVYAFLGVKKENEKNYPAHNSKFNIDEKQLVLGAKLYAQYARTFLDENNKRGS